MLSPPLLAVAYEYRQVKPCTVTVVCGDTSYSDTCAAISWEELSIIVQIQTYSNDDTRISHSL